jgi:pantetheine-phosphate adenylyltransferase
MKQHAIYPGSFDPLTYGHVNLVQRALGIFSTVTVAIASDSSKKTIFNLEERMDMIRKAFAGQSRVKVESFSGLLVNYVSQLPDSVVIRGIRSNVDFEYELALAQANKHLNAKMETIFMLTDTEFSFLSSSMIREIVALGGSTKGLLPDFIEKALAQKLAEAKKS